PREYLVIDTEAPRVTSVALDRRSGTVSVVYRDTLSGMAPESLVAPKNYTLYGPGLFRTVPFTIARVPDTAVIATDPRAVVGAAQGHPRLRAGLRGLRIIAGGVADVAGNPLDGESNGSLPSGDGHPGGNYFARFD